MTPATLRYVIARMKTLFEMVQKFTILQRTLPVYDGKRIRRRARAKVATELAKKRKDSPLPSSDMPSGRKGGKGPGSTTASSGPF